MQPARQQESSIHALLVNRSRSLVKQQNGQHRFGEHDETDLAREIESFERDISKYEQQSSDLISDAIKHGIVCGGMAHQGLKQHIYLRVS